MFLGPITLRYSRPHSHACPSSHDVCDTRLSTETTVKLWILSWKNLSDVAQGLLKLKDCALMSAVFFFFSVSIILADMRQVWLVVCVHVAVCLRNRNMFEENETFLSLGLFVMDCNHFKMACVFCMWRMVVNEFNPEWVCKWCQIYMIIRCSSLISVTTEELFIHTSYSLHIHSVCLFHHDVSQV